LENYKVIVTPKKIQSWIDRKKEFTVIDIRPADIQNNNPILGLEYISADENSIPNIKIDSILICQYGLVTEGLIIEKKLINSYSLLGGSEAWNEFYKKNADFSNYSRQMILPELGLKGQKKLLDSSIAIIGMGGLGCPAAQSLIISGIGRLVIVDGDKVELSNLHRQPLFNKDDVGLSKVEISKSKLNDLNKTAIIDTYNCYITQSNGLEILKNVDIIIDATDNFQSRINIDKVSKLLKIPMIYGGLYKYEGHVSIFNYKDGPSYTEVFPYPNKDIDSCDNSGTISMISGIIGNFQALEAIKVIVGIDDNLSGKLLIYDAINNDINKIEL
jgi:molybdopterin/thiamine biosynthesis adenylyltransferase